MSMAEAALNKTLLEVLRRFQVEFHRKVVSPIQSHFPNHPVPQVMLDPITLMRQRQIESQFPGYPVPREVQAILREADGALQAIGAAPGESIPVAQMASMLATSAENHPRVFKQAILLFRRARAAWTEELTEKTVQPALADSLEEDVKVLDALVNDESFKQIAPLRLPRLKDYLPVQFIEATTTSQAPLLPRQYDEKFHILQAPSLFLPDLAHFRDRCEDRETALAIAFLDIDGFKGFNTTYSDTKVDRNVLPRFMQAMEAQVFHHGYAYRQGGDEYLLLIPSLSKPLAVAFLDELRQKLAALNYPEIVERTTVSIGMCVVEPDCPLTDRELRDRAVHAKNFAKANGKNCLATYDGSEFVAAELRVVKASA